MIEKTWNRLVWVLMVGLVCACTGGTSQEQKSLPYLGIPKVVKTSVDGINKSDTIKHRIKAFSFLNQDSVLVDNQSLSGKIYVADFFFTSCPSICPIMKKELLRVYDKYKTNNKVSIVSHTIDPGYDDVARLNDYAKRLEVSAPSWHFLTGDLFAIYDIAETSYMTHAEEDMQAPGGFAHSGAFTLIDDQGHVRGAYDGTVSEQVDLLLKDMDILLAEVSTRNTTVQQP